MMMRRWMAAVCFGAVLVCGQMRGQMAGMESHAHAKGAPSTTLTMVGLEGKTLTLSAAELKEMPRTTVTVMNGHTSASETYAGVLLTALLTRVGVPVGKDLKGQAYVMYVVAEGTDGYRVLYSLDEVDGTAHAGEVIVADTLNGASLGDAGAFGLVSSEDKRPARWVHNLTKLTVGVAK